MHMYVEGCNYNINTSSDSLAFLDTSLMGWRGRSCAGLE